MRIKLILDAEKYARIPEPEYPKIGQPFDTVGMENVGTARSPIPKVSKRFQPHLIDSGSNGHSTGRFINYWVETEERTLEITANLVAEERRKKKLLANSNKKQTN